MLFVVDVVVQESHRLQVYAENAKQAQDRAVGLVEGGGLTPLWTAIDSIESTPVDDI